MNITDLVSNLRSTSALSKVATNKAAGQTQGADKTTASDNDPVKRALSQANQRVEQQLQKSEVKLSALGQVKSAVAELQTASRTLNDTKTTESVANAKAAAQTFVDAFNNANKAASQSVSRSGKTNGALADEGRARVAANELSRSLSNTSTASDLKNIGITTDKNGTFKLDTKKFEQAFQNDAQGVAKTLSSVGTQVERTASRQLDNNGNLGKTISVVSKQVQALEAEQSRQQDLANTLQTNNNDRLNSNAAAGIAAYQKIFTL